MTKESKGETYFEVVTAKTLKLLGFQLAFQLT
jgi:hypothetical protein